MNWRLFEPMVMFFGLTNSLATFQLFMNHIFKELILKDKVSVYINNILIYLMDIDEHQKVTEQVLQILQDNNLYLKPAKCEFEKEEVEYLRVIIGKGQIQMDPKKVKAIIEWPTPTEKKHVQSFLGFANFYRRFIKGYSGVTKPLTNLMGKVKWLWALECQEAFEEMKSRIASKPVLHMPIDNVPF